MSKARKSGCKRSEDCRGRGSLAFPNLTSQAELRPTSLNPQRHHFVRNSNQHLTRHILVYLRSDGISTTSSYLRRNVKQILSLICTYKLESSAKRDLRIVDAEYGIHNKLEQIRVCHVVVVSIMFTEFAHISSLHLSISHISKTFP